MKKITSAAAAVQANIQHQTAAEVKPAAQQDVHPAAPAPETEKKAGGRPKIYDGPMARVNFKIPASLLQDVRYLSDVEGKSMTQLFISVFEDEIEKHADEIKALKAMRGKA